MSSWNKSVPGHLFHSWRRRISSWVQRPHSSSCRSPSRLYRRHPCPVASWSRIVWRCDSPPHRALCVLRQFEISTQNNSKNRDCKYILLIYTYMVINMIRCYQLCLTGSLSHPLVKLFCIKSKWLNFYFIILLTISKVIIKVNNLVDNKKHSIIH